MDVMEKFDKKYQYLSRNLEQSGAFEAMVLIPHTTQKIQHGLHMHHNEN
jgi:hypothetical protein